MKPVSKFMSTAIINVTSRARVVMEVSSFRRLFHFSSVCMLKVTIVLLRKGGNLFGSESGTIN